MRSVDPVGPRAALEVALDEDLVGIRVLGRVDGPARGAAPQSQLGRLGVARTARRARLERERRHGRRFNRTAQRRKPALRGPAPRERERTFPAALAQARVGQRPPQPVGDRGRLRRADDPGIPHHLGQRPAVAHDDRRRARHRLQRRQPEALGERGQAEDRRRGHLAREVLVGRRVGRARAAAERRGVKLGGVGPVARRPEHRAQLAVRRHRRAQAFEVLARVRRADEQHVRAPRAAAAGRPPASTPYGTTSTFGRPTCARPASDGDDDPRRALTHGGEPRPHRRHELRMQERDRARVLPRRLVHDRHDRRIRVGELAMPIRQPHVGPPRHHARRRPASSASPRSQTRPCPVRAAAGGAQTLTRRRPMPGA